MRLRLLLTGVGVCLLALIGTADVVLNPGYVTGNVGLSNWTFDRGSVSVHGNASGFSGSTSFSNANTYTVTVQGGQTYNWVSEGLWTNSSPYTSFNVSVNSPLVVGVGATVTQNLYAAGATIEAGATATGATINSITAQAWGSITSTTSFSGYVSSYGAAAARVPVAATSSNINVNVNVYLTFTDANGNSCPKYRSYTRTIAGGVAEGNITNVSQAFDLSSETCVTGTGSIAGTIELKSLPSSVGLTGLVYFSGPESRYQSFTANPFAYLFDNVKVGQYYTQVQASFAAPYASSLYFPNGGNYYTDVAVNTTTTRDFVFDAGTVTGNMAFTGPLAAPGPSTYRYFYFVYDYTQPSPQPNYGGSSNVTVPAGAGGAYGAVLTVGKWLWGFGANMYLRNADGSIRQIINFSGSERGAPIDVTAGAALTRDQTIQTSEGDLVFDVVEGAGQPTIMISNPNATLQFYDAATGRNAYISAYSYEQNAATPTLKVIGPPGHYTFDAYAIVNNSYTKFVSSSINLGLASNTPSGSNVQVPLLDAYGNGLDVNLTFSNVNAAGDTSASTTNVGPAPPGSFQILSPFGGAKYLSISTTATFTPPVTISIEYDPTELGLLPGQEKFLQLWHYNCEATPCAWEMINDPPPPSPTNPDIVNHVITGKTTSFSVFALMLPPVTSVPPDVACVGSAASPKILSMPQNACRLPINASNGLAGACSGGGGGLSSCTFDNASELSLGLGTHALAVRGVAGDGSAAECTSYVTVVDAEAPSLSLAATPTVLWPLNHKLQPIQLSTSATDSCDARPAISCSATSNEAVNGSGDGNTNADIVWQDGQLFLRAERSGSADGRIYTIACTATDASGNSSTPVTTNVTVPHDRR